MELRRVIGTGFFIVVGLLFLAYFAVGNPLVLHPRLWTWHIVFRSIGFDSALLIVGCGLISRRRWAALFASAAGIVGAIWTGSTREIPMLVLFLLPAIVAATCWPALVPINRKPDAIIAVTGVCLSVAVEVLAYAIHARHW